MAVNDVEDVTFCLRTVLQETGLFEVDSFTDPEEALSSFKPNFYYLVILDIKMPNMDGFEIYEKIKRKTKKSAYVFLQPSLILVIRRKYIRI
jgi:CheY-like chemotaxis protein